MPRVEEIWSLHQVNKPCTRDHRDQLRAETATLSSTSRLEMSKEMFCRVYELLDT